MSEREAAVETFVAIGSNINPEANILRALALLAKRTNLVAVSTFYRTRALGRPEQPDFLNGVCHIRTDVPPLTLRMETLRPIEERLGRVRTGDKHGARTIDLDLVLYGTVTAEYGDWRLPDPDIGRRSFVAVPLLELAPDLVLPDTGERLEDMARLCADEPPLRRMIEFTKRIRETVLR